MSAMKCIIQRTNKYLHFKVSGKIEIDPLLPHLKSAIHQCLGLKDSKLFLDLWEVEDELVETYATFGGITGTEIYLSCFETINKPLRIVVLGQKFNSHNKITSYTPGTCALGNARVEILHTYDHDTALNLVS